MKFRRYCRSATTLVLLQLYRHKNVNILCSERHECGITFIVGIHNNLWRSVIQEQCAFMSYEQSVSDIAWTIIPTGMSVGFSPLFYFHTP